MSRVAKSASLFLSALLLVLQGCERSEAPPSQMPVVGPLPLERPARTAAQLAREARQDFEAKFAPAVLEALRDLDWAPLGEEIERPALAYQLLESCPIEYVQNTRLSTANDMGGLYKVILSNRFVLARVPVRSRQGKAGRRAAEAEAFAQYTPRLLALFQERPDHQTTLDIFGAQELSPRTFRLADRRNFFRGESSPIFFSALHRLPLKKTSKTARTLDQGFLPDFFPELPDSTSVGAETSWNYNLIFDKVGGLQQRPHGHIRLEAWLRVREQRVAYLTARWPQDEEVWLADPELPIFSLKKRSSATTYLQQKGAVEGHFLVSENGFVLFAYFEGVALETTESQLYSDGPGGRARRAARGSSRELVKITDREEVFFSFAIKALQDCNGSFLHKVEAAPISAGEIKQLAEEFISLFTIGRKKEALRRLSPEIRYAFTEEFISQMLTKQFEFGGMDSFGRPLLAEGAALPENALDFEGFNKNLKIKTYSSFRGEIRGGIPVLTFIGTSSSPDRTRWDILELSADNIIFTQVKVEPEQRRPRR